MIQKIRLFRIFLYALSGALLVVAVKYVMHYFNLELIEQSSLHNSVVSSVTFVLGFLLSATIADYKETERIPADFATQIEDMYDDACAIHDSYPVFDMTGFGEQLKNIARGFGEDVRSRKHDARKDIRGLTPYFAAMEKGGVPANFIVKLKQQQVVLLRHRHRVTYIQRIRFIPSATILSRSIVCMLIILLLVTNVDPFYGGLAIVGIITFVLLYMLILIDVISTPFHTEGTTRDDVSMFLIRHAIEHLEEGALASK